MPNRDFCHVAAQQFSPRGRIRFGGRNCGIAESITPHGPRCVGTIGPGDPAVNSAPHDTVVIADLPTPQSADALFDAVYARLKAMAGRQLAKRDRGTLDTTALVHELYLRVGTQRELAFAHPAQFFAYAARAMRHLLADRARDHLRQRAGGDWQRMSLSGADQHLAVDSAEHALTLDTALAQLEQADTRAARVVELRYFAGLPLEQIAELLGLTRRTIDRDWRFARAFLHDQLG
jgi:RNA polymerase sigma factor (TIGR02999 family)